MIEAADLKKAFGTTEAVSGLSFSVGIGEVVGFLGPNGAGKTTTFRMIAGTIGPSAGTIKIGGKDLQESPIEAKRLIGYMPENAPLYHELTTKEYLSFRAELKSLPRITRKRSVESAAEKAGASSIMGVRIGHLSKGFRQRVALADALLGDPPVLLLDEPTSGLDPNQVLEVRRLIRSLKSKHAIMLSTHILSEVEATCSRALVIHQGRMVGSGTLDELRKSRSPTEAIIVVRGNQKALEACLAELGIEPTGAHFAKLQDSAEEEEVIQATIPLITQNVLSDLVAVCVRDQLAVLKATTLGVALDDVFAHLTEASS